MTAPPGVAVAGPTNSLLDVAGLRVGQHTAIGHGFRTGTTVVLAPEGGMVAGVDVRGGGPATHETDLLEPTASVERIHALALTGGSAYGLVACTGVMLGLAERGIGLQVGPNPGEVVPLVPGAALFDLGRGGDFRARPTAEFGAAALAAALIDGPVGVSQGTVTQATVTQRTVTQGSVGAGTGAVTGNLKGGIGTASIVLDGGGNGAVTVAALVAVNAAGSPIDPRTGELLGARLLLAEDGPALPIPDDDARRRLLEITAPRAPRMTFAGDVISNTTLVVVATDAALTKAQCTKFAAVAQNGLARALNPVHTMFDGDIVFGLSTGTAGVPDPVGFHRIAVAGADVVTRAIVRALLAAQSSTTSAGSWPSWSDVVAGPLR
jgi:L-aminopeptidase/D-esterase-like protein